MIGEHGEELFYFPSIRAENWTPHGRKVLVRAERPPARASVVWTPQHRETEGRALGFVVYGTVIRVGPGAWEPAWCWDGHRLLPQHQHRDLKRIRVKVQGAHGPEDREIVDVSRLVFVPCSVKPGDKVVWAHGWGPRVELAEGTHFSIHEAGLQATWTTDHAHCWHATNGEHYFGDRPQLTVAMCCGCDEYREIDARSPACGDRALGPRITEHVESYNPTRIEPPPGDPPPDPDDERPRSMVFEGESEI